MEQTELEKKIEALRNQFEDIKISLEPNNESPWAVFCSKEDQDNYADEKRKGEKFKVRLLNRPVTWHGADWGSEVIVTNMGNLKPYAFLKDNDGTNHDEVKERRAIKAIWDQPNEEMPML